MRREEILFDRPEDLSARVPPEERGLARDEVRLLVSTPEEDQHRRFRDLPELLSPGNLLVVNESATLPAALEARGTFGAFRVHLCTRYGERLWLVEPRWSSERPGPLPLAPGDAFDLVGVRARVVGEFPGQPRLLFLALAAPIDAAVRAAGRPIQYAYVARDYPLARYQTVFARVEGSAEMPSAARPFSPRVVRALAARGIAIAPIVLHTGVSSLEVTCERVEDAPMYPEPFAVPASTVAAIERTRSRGGRVVAVGTSVVRALESAWDGERVRPIHGFTRLFVRPGRPVRSFDALLTGLHDSASSHLALLGAVVGAPRLRRAYRTAVDAGYLWHEFGDSHLLVRAS